MNLLAFLSLPFLVVGTYLDSSTATVPAPMAFFTELWELVFTPGTSPALLKATHASFVLLLLSLGFLVYLTGLIHYINLFVIASLLYGTVIWFVNELQQAKLKNNEELGSEAAGETPKTEQTASTSDKADVKLPVRRRKV